MSFSHGHQDSENPWPTSYIYLMLKSYVQQWTFDAQLASSLHDSFLSLRALLMHLHQPALALLLVPRFFIYFFFFRKSESFWILILLGVFSTWFPQLQFQRASFAKFVSPHLACEVDHDSTGALNS